MIVTPHRTGKPAVYQSLSGWTARNWHVMLPFVPFLLLAFWFVTNGTGRLFVLEPPVRLESTYDGLAAYLSEGRFDVSIDAIQGEGFVVNGKVYAYFPPTPAFPRIVLNHIWPRMYGRWAKLFCLLFGMAGVIGALAMYRECRGLWGSSPPGLRDRWLEGLLVLCAGIGSTALWLNSKAFVYHEAILCGSAMALWSAVLTVRFWRTLRFRWPSAASVLAFLAFFARGSSALGALALLAATALLAALAAWSARRSPGALGFVPGGLATHWRRTAVLVGLTILVTGTVYLWYNWVRWGDPFDPQPLRYNVQYVGSRIDHIHGRIMNPAAVPRNFVNYWLSPTIRREGGFPWIRFAPAWFGETPSIPYAYIEHQASVLYTSAPLLLLFMAGGWMALRRTARDLRPLALIVCLFAGTIPMLAYVALCHRYIHDFYPALAAGAALGLVALRETGRQTFRAVVSLLLPLGFLSAFVVFALTFVFQRDLMWLAPEARPLQLQRLSLAIDETIEALRQPVRSTAVSVGCRPLTEPDGERIRLFDCATRTWRSLPKPVDATFGIKVPNQMVGLRETLVTAGEPPRSESLFISIESGHEVRLGHDHWGTPAVVSDAIEARQGDELQIRMLLDSTTNQLRVWANGVEVLSRRYALHDWNPAGGSASLNFAAPPGLHRTGEETPERPGQAARP